MTITDLKNTSYVPYSNRPQATVVESENGTRFPGVRIENISFPLTISAVQNAIFCCLSEGEVPQTLFIEEDYPAEKITYWEKLYSIECADIKALKDFTTSPVVVSVNDIPAELTKLLDRAVVDESDFPVAALLKTADGYITGVNIETPDWSRGLCAERVALAKAISHGMTDFQALYVHTRGGEFSSPCGACRQVLLEHLPHHPVHLHHSNGSQSTHFTSDLLPYSFQSLSLQNKSTS